MRLRPVLFILSVWLLPVVGIQSSKAQVRVVKFEAIQKYLKNSSDTVVVLNFWATWCIPCVNELPYFEKLYDASERSSLKLILVSLDFKRELDTRVKTFVTKNNLSPEVLLLDEPDYNSWIDQVDSSWSGAIPATLVITSSKNYFFEKEFTSYAELERTIKPLIQK